MKNILIGFSFFTASIYMGVMWALHFFWYPSWQYLNLGSVQDAFVGPTSRATSFFTILVPIMMVCCIILIITEWKKPTAWTTWVMTAGILGATLVGQLLIIPINKTVAAGVADQQTLTTLLERWMMLNNVRMAITTVMWLGCLFFCLVRKNNP
ncbi:anthrone oxygenase family protein [Dinghuibacter silviterrae]|uniref:Uncharacterized protein DUF1772 n=1 Tax=Dinghuibacter silviterrae TaxID=1539049 RepID=A0A4R8DIF3_9BACT|nr:anthrone oxygenase family protein [Dinghuibacter silviterrae]TDW96750.1 uncharacterized protein DUF1772 [Dinghuibacter silviterrae]